MFLTAGEKRKFANNMQYERSARQIGILALSFVPFIAPIAIVALGLIAVFTLMSGGHPSFNLADVHKHIGHSTPFLMGSMVTARGLREQRAKLVADAQALLPDTGKMTVENRTKFDAIMKDADDLKTDIDRIERMEAEQRTAPAAAQPTTEERAKDNLSAVREFRTQQARFGSKKALEVIGAERRAKVEAMNAEFWAATKLYLAGGDANLTPEARAILRGTRAEFRELGVRSCMELAEYRDMGSGGGNALQGVGGGYFVPVGFVDEVEDAMKFYGEMLQSSSIVRTASGQPLPWPTDNDTTNAGELVGEGQQVSVQDIALGNIVFGAYKFSTKLIKVSIELLQDSAFNLETFVLNKFGVRLGRIVNTLTTVGTGVNQPKGIVPAATAGPTAVGAATNDGGAETGATSIGSDDLVALEHSVDRAYRRGAAYMMHDLTLQYLKQLKDKYGRPLWRASIGVGAPDLIGDYPYFVNNDMDQIATTKKTVLFGQLSKYQIRAVKELAVIRLSERFADYGQVAFIGFARYDGNLLDAGTHPVKYLVQA
jgi:HK97 family phage major capsid protein